MNVRITSAVWQDLQEIGDWVAADDPVAAVSLTDDLLDAAHEVAAAPFRYPQVPELDRSDIRKRTYRGYLIVFRVADEIEVLHIVHGRRNYLSLLQDL